MLSGILNSDRAIAVNIQIMRVFTRIRQMLSGNTELHLEIEKIKKKLDNQDKKHGKLFLGIWMSYWKRKTIQMQEIKLGIRFNIIDFLVFLT